MVYMLVEVGIVALCMGYLYATIGLLCCRVGISAVELGLGLLG